MLSRQRLFCLFLNNSWLIVIVIKIKDAMEDLWITLSPTLSPTEQNLNLTSHTLLLMEPVLLTQVKLRSLSIHSWMFLLAMLALLLLLLKDQCQSESLLMTNGSSTLQELLHSLIVLMHNSTTEWLLLVMLQTNGS